MPVRHILDPEPFARYVMEEGADSFAMSSIKHYVERGIYPGDALGGLLENDLKKFLTHADERYTQSLVPLFKYVYNFVPADCWGSREAVVNYVKHGTKGVQR